MHVDQSHVGDRLVSTRVHNPLRGIHKVIPPSYDAPFTYKWQSVVSMVRDRTQRWVNPRATCLQALYIVS